MQITVSVNIFSHHICDPVASGLCMQSWGVSEVKSRKVTGLTKFTRFIWQILAHVPVLRNCTCFYKLVRLICHVIYVSFCQYGSMALFLWESINSRLNVNYLHNKWHFKQQS